MSVPDVDVVVFDVLGTLVDEPSGLRAGLQRALPEATSDEVANVMSMWSAHIESAQADMRTGRRPFEGTDVLNREAAEIVLVAAGIHGAAKIEDLAESGWRLPAWPDSAHGLKRLAERFPIIGLSNAAWSDLVRLNAYAGLRFHLALSAQSVGAYKPTPDVYRLAVEAVGLPPERVLMVAAHSWDLRGARAVGLRTAYVRRPVGDPPADSERFDIHGDGLDHLAEQLNVRPDVAN